MNWEYDWWWFLQCYAITIFRPFYYMEEIKKIKRSKKHKLDIIHKGE